VEAVAGSGRRIVEAVVARSPGPGTPALIWVADPASLRDPGGTLTLDGADVARPGAGALAPLAAPGDPVALDGWIATHGARVTVTPAGVAALNAPPPPVAELATRLRAAGAAATGTLVPAGSPPLALTLVTGDLAIASTALGRGLLLVDGLLDITGTFAFNGVVVASAGIRVAAGARLDVAGSIWLGSGASLVVDGDARVAARADALDAAETLLRLPPPRHPCGPARSAVTRARAEGAPHDLARAGRRHQRNEHARRAGRARGARACRPDRRGRTERARVARVATGPT